METVDTVQLETVEEKTEKVESETEEEEGVL